MGKPFYLMSLPCIPGDAFEVGNLDEMTGNQAQEVRGIFILMETPLMVSARGQVERDM